MKFGAIGQRHRPTGDADARALREARIATARQNLRWEEIPDDLVRRGHCLVSAGSDEVYLPHRGVVFESGRAVVIADRAALVFAVTDDGELRFLDRQAGLWSEVVARRARQAAKASR